MGTISVGEGARTLAMRWGAAWAAGGNLGWADPDALRAIYENPDFVRSVAVDEIEQEIRQPNPI